MTVPRILVVEDSVMLRRLACEMLRLDGFDTAEACDGNEALARLSAERFDMVLSDRVMAPMDGLDLLHGMRANTALATIPFVLMSGEQTPEAVSHALGAGIDGYLAKPFGRAQLSRQVTQALARKRQAA